MRKLFYVLVASILLWSGCDIAEQLSGNEKQDYRIAPFTNEKTYQYIEIEIGDWNMKAMPLRKIPHQMGMDYKRIRSINVIIRDDDDYQYTNLIQAPYGNIYHLDGDIYWIDDKDIYLQRNIGGGYDNTAYDKTGFNRGWVTIQLVI